MAVNELPITIVGCGPGSPDYVTPAAQQAVARAEVLVGAPRLLDLFPESGAERVAFGADVAQALDEIALRCGCKRVAVLVSGDPGLCSLAPRVLERFGGGACQIVPGISSVQVAFARVGLDWLDVKIISAHGKDPEVPPDALAGEGKIAILAGRAGAMCWIAELAAFLGESHSAFVCESLTLDDERVRRVPHTDLASLRVSSRTLVLLVRRDLLS